MEPALRDVVDALSTLHSLRPTGQSDPMNTRNVDEDRARASRVLETFRERPDVVPLALELYRDATLANRSTRAPSWQIVRHFALHSLLHQVVTQARWDQVLSSEQKEILGRSAMEICDVGLGGRGNEEVFVERVAVDLLVALIQRGVLGDIVYKCIYSWISRREEDCSRIGLDVLTQLGEALAGPSKVMASRGELTRQLKTGNFFAVIVDLILFNLNRADDAMTVKALVAATKASNWIESLTDSVLALPAFARVATTSTYRESRVHALRAILAYGTKRNFPVLPCFDTLQEVCKVVYALKDEMLVMEAVDAVSAVIVLHHTTLIAAARDLASAAIQATQAAENFSKVGMLRVAPAWKSVFTTPLQVGLARLVPELIPKIFFSLAAFVKESREEDAYEDGDEVRGEIYEGDDQTYTNLVRVVTREFTTESLTALYQLLAPFVLEEKSYDSWNLQAMNLLLEGVCAGIPGIPRPTDEQKKPWEAICWSIASLVVLTPSTSSMTNAQRGPMVYALRRLIPTNPYGVQNFLGPALNLWMTVLESPSCSRFIKKRCAVFILQTCRTAVHDPSCDDKFLTDGVLPALAGRAARMMAPLPTDASLDAWDADMDPGTRIVMMESIIVLAGRSSNEGLKREITAQLLYSHFQQIYDERATSNVLANLLEQAPLQSARAQPWDKRGFIEDMKMVPQLHRRFHLAVMTIATCVQDGAKLPDAEWPLLLSFVVRAARVLHELWRTREPGRPTWWATLHPVDARILLGGRRAEVLEDLIDRLSDYGRDQLGEPKCATISFLSSIRSALYDLLNQCLQRLHVKTEDLQQDVPSMVGLEVATAESRHLSHFVSAVVSGGIFGWKEIRSANLAAPVGSAVTKIPLGEWYVRFLMAIAEQRLDAPSNLKPVVELTSGETQEVLDLVEEEATSSLEGAWARSISLSVSFHATWPFSAHPDVPPPSLLRALTSRLKSTKSTTTIRWVLQTWRDLFRRFTPMSGELSPIVEILVPIVSAVIQAKDEETGVAASELPVVGARALTDLVAEAICFAVWGQGPAELVAHPHELRTGDAVQIEALSRVLSIWGDFQSAVVPHVTTSMSEKGIRDVVDRFFRRAERDDVEMGDQMGRPAAAQGRREVGSWHDAKDAKDLAVYALFDENS